MGGEKAMREIKFRAWDKKTKKMRELDNIAFHNSKGSFEHCGNDKSPKLVWLWGYSIIECKDILLKREEKEFILMQYTGLKDKNGKEIYEGDIFHYLGREVKNGKQIYPKRQIVIGKGNFHKDCFYLMNILEDRGGEVIGNIWENKELLK